MPPRQTGHGVPAPGDAADRQAPTQTAAAGVDWRQCRVLVRASLRQDLRRVGRSIGLGRSGRGAAGLVGFALFQAALGGFVSIPLWLQPADVFPGAVLHFSYVTLSVASLLLLDGSALIVAPADHDVVASRPVTSRTFFAARAATLLVYVAFLAGTQSLVPVAAYFFAGGPHVVRGMTGLLVTGAIAFATAGLVVALYGALVRLVSPRRLRLGLTVVQLAFSFALYGVLLLMPGRAGRALLLDPIAERPWWIAALPPALAAEAVSGGGSAWLLPALLASAALAWLLAARVLSLEYAATVSALSSLPSGARPRRSRRWFRAGETHAVALLARAQFRDDLRFRMGVLSIVPLTLIYLLIGATGDGGADARHGHPSMVYLGVLLFPAIVRGAFSRSDAWRAAWLFYASPASAGRLLLGLKNVIVAWFLLPYSLAIGVLLVAVLPSVPDALLSAVLPPLVAHLLLLALLMADPSLPFSRPPEVAANTRGVILLMMPAIVLAQWLPFALSRLAGAPVVAWLSVAGLVAANVVLEWALRRRVDRLASRAEFAA